MVVYEFRAEHAELIEWQAAQKPDITHTNPAVLAVAGEAYTAVSDEGDIMVCGGIAKVWEGRWMLWAIVSAKAGRHMVRIVKGIKRFLDAHAGVGRVEMVVRSDFAQGHRLAQMIGMTWHHHEEKFLPDEVDADIYVRFM